MNKYKVYGTAIVHVTKEVWANSEEEAYEKASDQLAILECYCGNGGYDRLIGVENDGESVDVYDDIEYNDIKMIECDPNYFECINCGDQCDDCEQNDGTEYWHCPNCGTYYDSDGDEFYPDDEEEE